MSSAALKDKALEEYYQALFEMHGSAGWQKVQEDFGRMAETHSTLAGIDTIEQLWFRKGQLDIIALVLAHADTCERAYNTLIAEQEGGEEIAITGGDAKVIE
jgi:hypothetical protein